VALVLLVVAQTTGPSAARGADTAPTLGAEERDELECGLREATARLERLRQREGRESPEWSDRLADAEVFAKGIAWALKYDISFTAADQKLLSRALERGRARVAALEAGRTPWADRRGKVVRGFVSTVDGSVQPYALVVPANYERGRPMRLDVVLHGSTRPVGMSELRFLARFDEPDEAAPDVPARDYIELHPLGRVENGYRWAGQTDVFEAIAAARRNYAIDPDRIVLRGMSMGASGSWHLGLKHPDRFVALGPYCGYVDTHEFSKTPLPNFVAVGPLPAHQEKTLHMLDSVDYAANAAMVPAIACMGEKDVFFEAHEIMSRAMARERLAMVNLIAPGTGHVLDPATHAEQMRRISTIVARGKDRTPPHIRFVTWTLKYSRCAWLQILGLEEHYRRAEVEAWVAGEGTIKIGEPINVTRLAILPPVAQAGALRVSIGGLTVTTPAREGRADRRAIAIGKRDGAWVYLGERDELRLDGKQPGLQGPIDDAFTAPFLCVRGTGVAWHRAVEAWSEAGLNRFAAEWSRYFRGALPVKDDTAVTAEDVERCNLILFGDPGNNLWIHRVLPQLPIRWTPTECSIGKLAAPSADHAPVLIQPSPLARGRYVVLNSGHTFHESELATLNYLLFPRLGDWALVKVAARAPEDGSPPGGEEVIGSGFFDERWGVGEPHTGSGEPDKHLGPSARSSLPRP
jgi:poly(3-hydroxybutyrate) depolymerase